MEFYSHTFAVWEKRIAQESVISVVHVLVALGAQVKVTYATLLQIFVSKERVTFTVLQVVISVNALEKAIHIDRLEKDIYVFLQEKRRVFCIGKKKVSCSKMENAFYATQKMVAYNLSEI